jgi:hypothetical protein
MKQLAHLDRSCPRVATGAPSHERSRRRHSIPAPAAATRERELSAEARHGSDRRQRLAAKAECRDSLEVRPARRSCSSACARERERQSRGGDARRRRRARGSGGSPPDSIVDGIARAPASRAFSISSLTTVRGSLE